MLGKHFFYIQTSVHHFQKYHNFFPTNLLCFPQNSSKFCYTCTDKHFSKQCGEVSIIYYGTACIYMYQYKRLLLINIMRHINFASGENSSLKIVNNTNTYECQMLRKLQITELVNGFKNAFDVLCVSRIFEPCADIFTTLLWTVVKIWYKVLSRICFKRTLLWWSNVQTKEDQRRTEFYFVGLKSS